MYMQKYPCVYMRGGTSKAVIFHEKDLPEDKSLWDNIFLKVMGTPDVKQIDGMGGTVSSTSKIAIVSPSDREDADVNYTFKQVDIIIPRVDGSANCGNISSAIGPFAIDEGLVEAVEPITVVRVLNTNTNKIIEEHVRVKDKRAMVHGNEVIKGVPGTGSRIDMYFEQPGGAVTGKLFPTGNKKDIFDVPDFGNIEVTVIDCSNPIVFIRARDLKIKGTELVELNNNKEVMEYIERIRCIAAEKCGFVDKWEQARTMSTSVPKVSIVSIPQDYEDMDGNNIKASEMDLCCRAVSVGKLHKAYPMTVAVGTGAAAKISGTIVNEIACLSKNYSKDIIVLGHSSGTTEVDMKMNGEEVLKGGVTRTARRIMDGYVYVRD
ncbi:MAG: PrpF domain-containing protein [Sedimentibacter saalensis]|uniref:2-methylaconitate cis-trans isomerase PrpF family protein n=1 Tax=Sedimentibacter saalensis TaxID=130788 RepID=UPI002B21A048|nr:PrpF domain-containing protein [Sedimentibacter saalensis]MEA5096839.1 PrpF domain-containing protein [Sedimentibacter saalensis]